eukprot:gb/GFBE01004322.1/.p1 GENE.gb/GFBE01004322.1/~~gb/GFBE01004322.1/.p1  ORF type:complete len:464 (+),score=72.49 gb/GFBE01004322.1/:1-1392(+)
MEDTPLMDTIADTSIACISEFRPQGLANLVWSYATLSIVHPPLLDALAPAAMAIAINFSPQGLANIAWAFATLRVENLPLMNAVAAVFRQKLSSASLRELALTAWAYANLSVQDVRFMEAVASSAVAKLSTTQLQGGKTGSSDVCPADFVIGLADALHACGAMSDEYFEAASAALLRFSEPLDAARGQVAEAEHSDSTADELGTDPYVLQVQPHMCAVWKPTGWVVNVSWEEAEACRQQGQDSWMDQMEEDEELRMTSWMTRVLGERYPIAKDPFSQHGIIHRLDKQTSGPLLCATDYNGYWAARLQFGARKVVKEYVCVCSGWLSKEVRVLETPLQYGRRQKQGLDAPGLRYAKTQVTGVVHLADKSGAGYSLVRIKLHTGRRNQIRAHLSYEGHPLIGDDVYGSETNPWCPRLFLHSYRLRVDIGDGPLDVRAPLPDDLKDALSGLTVIGDYSRACVWDWL